MTSDEIYRQIQALGRPIAKLALKDVQASRAEILAWEAENPSKAAEHGRLWAEFEAAKQQEENQIREERARREAARAAKESA